MVTIVAYKNFEMAADSSCWIENSEVTKIRKIYRIKGGLVGVAGDIHAIAKFIKWIKNGADEDEFPEGSLEAIMVDPSGKVTLWEGSAYCPVPLKGPYVSIGAGADFAAGAMFAGATAKEAVKAAIRHSAKCRPPVHVFSLW